jgi:type IV fimbrial biogenesis protein FimT
MNRRTRGFTLMELMVTLALAGVVLGIGVPAFKNFAANGRLTGAANETLVALVTSRNEAVRRQTRTSFCATSTPDSTLAICENTAKQGFIGFVDANSNCQRDTGEELVTNVVLHSEIQWKKNMNCVGYAPNGFRAVVAGEPSNARAVFCDARGTAKINPTSTISAGRGIEIVATGRSAVTRLYADLNTWAGGSTPVTCP